MEKEVIPTHSQTQMLQTPRPKALTVDHRTIAQSPQAGTRPPLL